MKKYNSRFYDDVDKALEDCNNHQDWNIINIYRTGWRQEVCVVYYTCTDASKQEWKPSDVQMKALDTIINHVVTKTSYFDALEDLNYRNLEKLYNDLKKLREE